MINSDAVVEAMIKGKGLTAPRVTPEIIDALVASLSFKVHRFGDTTTMVALAFLPNGFSVGQGQSACASPENFNAEIGEKIAVDNARSTARENLWFLEGYVLKKELSKPILGFQDRVRVEKAELMVKITALTEFGRSPIFEGLAVGEQRRLQAQLGAMIDYAGILTDRINAF